MDELIKAIKTLYGMTSGDIAILAKAVALRSKTLGGLWLSQAPKESQGVYILIIPNTSPIEYAKGTSSTKVFSQECNVQFTFATLSGVSQDIVDAMKAFRTLYDFCALPMTTMSLLSAIRKNEHGPVRDDDTGGYLGYMEYKFLIGG